MAGLRPRLEKLQPLASASWARRNRVRPGGIPFQWHHHPEYELALTLNSRGYRFVGAYDDGDLVLVGLDLPHTWASTDSPDPGGPHVAQIIWFPPDWTEGPLGALPECAALRDLPLAGATVMRVISWTVEIERNRLDRSARRAEKPANGPRQGTVAAPSGREL